MMLFNKPHPFPDELSVSWLERIASANGYEKLETMINCLHNEERVVTSRYFIGHFERNSIRHPERLCKLLNISTLDFLQRMTMFPIFFPFIRREQQDKHILELFRETHLSLLGMKVLLLPELYYCPLCKEEDLALYNATYLRRIHQVPGIYHCPIHHISLKNVDTDEDICLEPIAEAVRSKYGRFCSELLSEWLPCGVADVESAVKSRMKDLGFSAEMLQKAMIDDGYEIYLSSPVQTILKWLRVKQGLKYRASIIAICSYLFDDVDMFKKYLNVHTLEESFRKVIADKNMELVSDYNDSVVQLKHSSCGNVFYTTPHALICGWECSSCDGNLSEKEMFQRLVSKLERGAYKCVDKSNVLNKKEKILHMICERQYEVDPVVFLGGRDRCKCTELTKKKVNDLLDKNKSFKLILFDDNTRTMSLYSSNCKHTFDAPYIEFKWKPVCPICNKNKNQPTVKGLDYSARTILFKYDVEDLVGDEYEICSEYISSAVPLPMKHIHCGEVTPITPARFLAGARCKHCARKIWQDEFKQIVLDESGGLYEAVSFNTDKALVLIRNTETGDETWLKKALVLQELRRPTKSIILPLEGKQDRSIKPTLRPVEIIINYVKDNFCIGDFLTRGDIKMPDITSKNIESAFLTMFKNGVLCRKDRGIYQLVK